MKKLLFFLSAIAFVAACDQAEIELPNTPNELPGEIVDTEGLIPEVIYANVADEKESEKEDSVKTRTYIENDSQILWHNGDNIWYCTDQSIGQYKYTGEDGAKKATFSPVYVSEHTDQSSYNGTYAVYPHSAKSVYAMDWSQLSTTVYPTRQTYAEGSFGREANIMVAKSETLEDDDLYFRNACGYLVIKLHGSVSVKEVQLTTGNGKELIAGPATISFDANDLPQVKMLDTTESSATVTLDCSNGGNGVKLSNDANNPTEFWFALPPVEISSGIRIKVTDTYNCIYSKETTKPVSVTRNRIQPMAALQFAVNSVSNNRFYYTRPNNNTNKIELDGDAFNTTISSHYYDSNIRKFAVEFNGTLTTIGKSAFEDSDISSIILPETVTTIEEDAFYESNLEEITIPGSVTKIGVDAFYNCESLTSVTFKPNPSNTPIVIGYSTYLSNEIGPFYYSPLQYVNINRPFIQASDFDGSSYTRFTPDQSDEGLFSIRDYNKGFTTTVVLGNRLTEIPAYMFSQLPMQSISIPGSVTKIGNWAFDDCKKLTNLTFEASTSACEIGFQPGDDEVGPFYDSPLRNIAINRIVSQNAEYMQKQDGVDEGIFAISQHDEDFTTSVTIGYDMREIPQYMFSQLPVQSISIPGSVTKIGNHAFSDCYKLSSLTIPGSVKTIENDAFDNCESLSNLTFEASDTPLKIGYQPGTDQRGPFYDSPLENIELNREIEATNEFAAIQDEVDEGIFSISKYNDEDLTTRVRIGPNVQTISSFMFCHVAIESLTIPGTVNTIEDDSFYDCPKLKDIEFKASGNHTPLIAGHRVKITEDGQSTSLFSESPFTIIRIFRQIQYASEKTSPLFAYLQASPTVIIGEEAKVVNAHAFVDTNIKALYIYGSVTTIGTNAFSACDKLETLSIEGNDDGTPLEVWSASRYNQYYFSAFCNSPLTNIRLERQIIEKGESNLGIFEYCSGYNSGATPGDHPGKSTNVYIGNQVHTIAPRTFRGAPITEISISSTVHTIGEYAFYDCKKLRSVTFRSETPPSLGDNPWNDDVSIYVPAKLVDTYKNCTTGWWPNCKDNIFAIPNQ